MWRAVLAAGAVHECFIVSGCRPQGFGEAGGMLRPTEHVPDKSGVIPPNAVSLF